MKYPTSCDTFVVLSGYTKNNVVIFGKNSDRPDDEVQDIVYYPSMSYPENSKIMCTYIEIDQVPETLAVVLSKPNWMWGAEMGGNSYGVCIGNEAIWAKVDPEEDKKLLGMDFVRLGLERGKTAREALEVITNLLEIHGQGGPCSNTEDLTYHNSYLIADSKDAWVLETVGKYWAAEHITTGFRNISNCLSIEGQVDLMSNGLKAEAEKYFNWDLSTEFNFRKIFSYGETSGRYRKGEALLRKHTSENNFDARSMMTILRHGEINMGGYGGGFATTSSQVSVLGGSGACHWFTGTSDSAYSIFKPFIFSKGLPDSSTGLTTSSSSPNDTQKCAEVAKHELYRLHEKSYSQITRNKDFQRSMRALEDSFLAKYSEIEARDDQFGEIFSDAVKSEISLYSEISKI